MKKWIVLLAFAMMIVPFAAVGAQNTRGTYTVTLTEDEINASFRVSNPAVRNWSNVNVDLQAPDRAVLSGVYTARLPRGQGTTTYAMTATYAATVVNGRITWTLTGATANGTAAPSNIITQINLQVSASWTNFIRLQIPGNVTSVTITETAISATVTR
ncbi:MAG: hypothetical protein SGI73_20080 [Chloroflexota bacterium]|mgnify:CR=1 FL=1|nr:hypothetical protein [Chloroflexota bacterium]